MRSVSWVFFAVVFMCTTVWLLADKCNQPLPTPMQPDVIARRGSMDRIHKEIQKQLQANQAELQRQRDSAISKLDAVEKELIRSEGNTRALAGRIRSRGTDTVKIVEDCNELVDTAVALANRVEAYRSQNDSLKTINDNITANAQQQINQLQAFNSDMRNSFNELNSAYQEQGKQLQKEQRKTHKKYVVGIGVGGGITTTGQPGGVVGIFIIRETFRL